MKNFHAGKRLRDVINFLKRNDNFEISTLNDFAEAIDRKLSSVHRMMKDEEFGIARLRLMRDISKQFDINPEFFEKEEAPMLLDDSEGGVMSKASLEDAVEKLTDAVEVLTDGINRLIDFTANKDKEINELKKQNRLLKKQKK